MKKLWLLLVGFVPIFLFAQDSGTWSISSHFQTDHNFIPALQHDLYYVNAPTPYTERTLQFTTGLGVNYRFKNNLELSSSIRYSRKREELTGYSNSPSDFVQPFDYLLLSYAPVALQYIEVPLLARFYFLPGKLKIHVESGCIGSYQLKQDPYTSEIEWLFGVQSGVGVNYFLNRWQFALTANYRRLSQMGYRTPYHSINTNVFGFEFKTAFSLNN